MIELPKQGNEDSQYDGSRMFTWLADLCGLSIDLVNFLLSQVFALFLASLFRSLLHPSKVSSGIRHAFGLTIGLFFGYFCFGQQAIHIAGLPALCYIVIRTQNPQIVQRMVMVVSMIYLSCVHLHRLYYDYGSYSLDITGPLMIITQKVTSLAFSIHDGLCRDESELSKSQQYHAIRKLPTALEFFSYVFHFQGLMAGPMVFYKDYIDFIEGYQFLKNAPGSNGDMDRNYKSTKIIVEPSPMVPVVKKFIGSLICAVIFMKFITMYPIKTIKDNDFIENTSFTYKFCFMMAATTVVRFKYYHAWLLADAICNNSGLGFNGYDETGKAKWDLISNIEVLSFEFASSMRNAINAWNLGTNRWLRILVYERVPKKYGTLLTFCLSAIWHGFYPGYYITFASGALTVTAARIGRKYLRYHFQGSNVAKLTYDILTIITTRLFMGYITFPFVLLEFAPSLRLYLKVYMCLHLVLMFTVWILPSILHGERKTISSEMRTSQKTYNSTTDKKTDKCDSNKIAATNISNLATNTTTTNANVMNGNGMNGTTILQNCVNDDDDNLLENSNNLVNMVDFPDKTITGFIENNKSNNSVDHRMQQKNERNAFNYGINDGLLRKRQTLNDYNSNTNSTNGTASTANNTTSIVSEQMSDINGIDTFLKKEIDAFNAAVQQTNMLPAVVLSNGHAK